MSNVKNRGADNSHKKAEQEVSIERLANIGEKVITSKGELTIKEPTLEQVIELLVYIVPIAELFKNTEDKTGRSIISEIILKPEVSAALRKISASLSNVEEDFFVGLGITDWLKVFIAIKKVVNWEELSELFSQLNLMELLNQVQ